MTVLHVAVRALGFFPSLAAAASYGKRHGYE